MGQSTFAKISDAIKGAPAIYFRCDPLIGDFTKPYDGKFIITTPRGHIEFTSEQVGLSKSPTFWYFFHDTICGKGNHVITWDIKKFISHQFHRHKPPTDLLEGSVIDAKYASAFMGQRLSRPPQTLSEALGAVGGFMGKEQCRLVNREVYVPLAFRVLPQMETTGIADVDRGRLLYSCYEIEGQANGRLLVPKVSKDYLTVHSMSPDQKAALHAGSSDEDWVFIVLDFNHMEVKMLQWLSGDGELATALAGDDFYASLVTYDAPEADKHRLGKLIFLPLVYGMQPGNLAKRLKSPPAEADELVRRLRDRFIVAFDWIESKQSELADNPIATDALGRQRDFSSEPPYKRRNFEVQSPASLVCLEKLCQLHNELPDNILLHIHDGYVLRSHKWQCAEVVSKACKVLQSESRLCPGLNFTVSCHVGTALNELIAVGLKPT